MPANRQGTLTLRPSWGKGGAGSCWTGARARPTPAGGHLCAISSPTSGSGGVGADYTATLSPVSWRPNQITTSARCDRALQTTDLPLQRHPECRAWLTSLPPPRAPRVLKLRSVLLPGLPRGGPCVAGRPSCRVLPPGRPLLQPALRRPAGLPLSLRKRTGAQVPFPETRSCVHGRIASSQSAWPPGPSLHPWPCRPGGPGPAGPVLIGGDWDTAHGEGRPREDPDHETELWACRSQSSEKLLCCCVPTRSWRIQSRQVPVTSAPPPGRTGDLPEENARRGPRARPIPALQTGGLLEAKHRAQLQRKWHH